MHMYNIVRQVFTGIALLTNDPNPKLDLCLFLLEEHSGMKYDHCFT